MEYYAAITKNEVFLHAVNLENIMLLKKSDTKTTGKSTYMKCPGQIKP